MSLTAADVAEIMRLVEDSSFDELTLEVDGMKLSFRRGAANPAPGAPAVPAASAQGAAPAAAAAPSVPAPAAAPARPVAAAIVDADVREVSAPLLGTFYRAPKPGAPPFVEIGSVVEEETVVAIIEVMKLMNTVRAGLKGTVTEILVADGTLVEYGEALLRVRTAG